MHKPAETRVIPYSSDSLSVSTLSLPELDELELDSLRLCFSFFFLCLFSFRRFFSFLSFFRRAFFSFLRAFFFSFLAFFLARSSSSAAAVGASAIRASSSARRRFFSSISSYSRSLASSASSERFARFSMPVIADANIGRPLASTPTFLLSPCSRGSAHIFSVAEGSAPSPDL